MVLREGGDYITRSGNPLSFVGSRKKKGEEKKEQNVNYMRSARMYVVVREREKKSPPGLV